MTQKYNVNQYTVETILNWIKTDQLVIPEIQRPFVWNSIKVRDLMDSLYHGYPVGYMVSWKNPDIRLKDGSISNGRRILIDGQQRMTALRAAILGESVIDKEYREIKIVISFNPIKEEFATFTPAIAKDKTWIGDISEFLKDSSGIFSFIDSYKEKNPDINIKKVQGSVEKLLAIQNAPIGMIELINELDIETVTEIFVRINSKGMVLSQADFAMSKIASYGNFGVNLRKLIDYFCHLAIEPKFYKHISENDAEFAKTGYLEKIAWLKNENDNLYDPSYSDVIRVSFMKEFQRGKLEDLVSLLSGRNFEAKTYEEEIVVESFNKLEKGILSFVNETNFERFIMIIKSAGFITNTLVKSQGPVNFSYALFLKLRSRGMSSGKIERVVRKWYAMSLLTRRYSGSTESIFDEDIARISALGAEKYLEKIEESELSDNFWNFTLPMDLSTTNVNHPAFLLFFASQVYFKNKGFLSKSISVNELIQHKGDIHHIFPKDYLQRSNRGRSDYNQIANFVYAQSEINISIGNKSPKQYFAEIKKLFKTKIEKYGNIKDIQTLEKNIRANAVPLSVVEMDINDYDSFLEERRKLIAKKIEKYYKSL